MFQAPVPLLRTHPTPFYMGCIDMCNCSIVAWERKGNHMVECLQLRQPYQGWNNHLNFAVYWDHWATGSLVAEECRIDGTILRLEFKPQSTTCVWITACME